MHKDDVKIERVTNMDQYANVSHAFFMREERNNLLGDFVRIHSGTDGITLCTKGWNNGHVRLSDEQAKLLAEELLFASEFSCQAKDDSAAIYAAKHKLDDYVKEIRSRYDV